jgi:hypothetical protein
METRIGVLIALEKRDDLRVVWVRVLLFPPLMSATVQFSIIRFRKRLTASVEGDTIHHTTGL